MKSCSAALDAVYEASLIAKLPTTGISRIRWNKRQARCLEEPRTGVLTGKTRAVMWQKKYFTTIYFLFNLYLGLASETAHFAFKR